MTSGPRADFRASAAPAVTVVMLAWKQPELLLRSLAALAAQADERVEVVLVLNGATPEVHEAVATRVTGAVVVIADLNIGFGGACNLGATSARGEFLVFLSDDTEVTPGWLDELLAVVRAHPEAGVVASVLLDPDGSIQEAGSRVLPDGTTLPLAAGRAVADASGFLADRPVDYGSGAAMLMPRDLFEQLGGFDPAFYPAYYEDVDLAFRARVAGRPVILAGAARVTHIGQASTGRGRYQRFASDHGFAAFLARWGDVVAQAPGRDAPLTALAPVEAAGRGLVRVDGLDEVPELRTTEGALRRALSSARENVAYLESELELADDRTRAASDRLAELVDRLDELERRGPLGIVKWRVGVFVMKHPRLAALARRPRG